MAGVTLLEDIRQRADAQGVAVRVVVPHRCPRTVLRIVGLGDVLPIHDSVEQAVSGRSASHGGWSDRPEAGKAP